MRQEMDFLPESRGNRALPADIDFGLLASTLREYALFILSH